MARINQTMISLMDQYGNTIQALPHTTEDAYLSVSSVSARVALPASGVLYRISAQKDIWINWGDVTVTATLNDGTLFLAGTEIVRPPVTATYIAAVTDDGSTGKLGITKLIGENE